MASRQKYGPSYQGAGATVPFDSVEEAWFWFIAAQEAGEDGARFGGRGWLPRPCQPLDIMKILDRLYKNRCLLWDHFKIMEFYGRRRLAPDAMRPREMRAHILWTQGMKKLGEVMESRGFVRPALSMSRFPDNIFNEMGVAAE